MVGWEGLAGRREVPYWADRLGSVCYTAIAVQLRQALRTPLLKLSHETKLS